MRALLLLLLLTLSGSGDAAEIDGFLADARSIELLINAQYAYLDRLPGGQMPVSAKLRAEADAVVDRASLLRYAERALLVLADHHAITGSSFADSWALVPSYADLWIEARGGAFVIEAVRQPSPAAQAGIQPGDRVVAIDAAPVADAVADFWADLGMASSIERAGFAVRVLAAGRRDRLRRLTIQRGSDAPRDVSLPNLYSITTDRAPLTASVENGSLVVTINDALGSPATIDAFDRVLAQARPRQAIIIDLTETPSGGNTVVARAIMGWFVSGPTGYQVHSLPAEERQTGIPRQWIEQVLPRFGKRHEGPVTVRVGRWTGSMGEGLAIGLHAIGARVKGDPMAGLRGAVYDHLLGHSGLVLKLPTERLSTVGGIAREVFIPETVGSR